MEKVQSINLKNKLKLNKKRNKTSIKSNAKLFPIGGVWTSVGSQSLVSRLVCLISVMSLVAFSPCS